MAPPSYVDTVYSEAEFVLHIVLLEPTAAMPRLSLKKVLLFKGAWDPNLITVQYPYVAGASDDEQTENQTWWFVYNYASDQGAFMAHEDVSDLFPVSLRITS